jgi:K+-dependent Na+/Ca+ exchanger-like protein
LDEIGKKLKMTSDISGATLMAAGSSAPELAVVIVAVLKSGSHEAIGVGTIVGSALFNLFVITGAALIIRNNAKLVWQPLVRNLLFYALSVVMLIWFFNDGTLTNWEAFTFVAGYAGYIVVLYSWKKILPYEDTEQLSELDTDEGATRFDKLMGRVVSNKSLIIFLVFIMSVAVISILSWALVSSAIEISEILGIPEIIIALTVVAVGTSIPDLVSSAIVAKQGRPGMAVNNAVGSNIFDILIGLGLPFLLYHVFSTGKLTVDYHELDIAFWFLMGSIVILTLLFVISRWKTNKKFGFILIFLYLAYLTYEIICAVNPGLSICLS